VTFRQNCRTIRAASHMKVMFLILSIVFAESTVMACIWDAESLFREKLRSHDLAKTILGQISDSEDPQKLHARIKELEANRKENDTDWWNNLAGAYLRLNQPDAAVKLLAPEIKKFPNDYGMHANLGTAYHLLGKYAEAEKEIARDLEINPDAHFGLEKYHLALLQYLVRNPKYQMRHVYVDECTASFLLAQGRFNYMDSLEQTFKHWSQDYTNIDAAESDFESFATNRNNPLHDKHYGDVLGPVAALDVPPPYRANWNLAKDTNFEEGVIYMAQMNPKEPACFTMLGIAAWRKHDYHLAATAFEKAISFGSPQTELLKIKIAGLNDYISHSPLFSPVLIFCAALATFVVVFAYYIYSKIRERRRA
jgi:hypothetical protein